MEKIRIGIIGAGQIAQKHLEMYKEIPQVEIVAACDIDENNLRPTAEKFGIADTYSDFRKLLERDDLDAVDVCLHNNLHAPVSIAAMEAGKNVYCEKPIAGSYVDGLAMINTAKECNRMLHIQLSRLYLTGTRAAKRLIDGGALGNIYHARSMGLRRRNRPYVDGYGTPVFVQKENAGGGALFDLGIYHISELLYLMGRPTPIRMSGKTYQRTDMHEGRRALSNYNVEELSLGFVRFDNDITMDLFESWAVHLDKVDSSSLVGDKGGVKLDPFSFHTTLCDVELDCVSVLENVDYRWKKTIDNENAYTSSQAHWIAALQGRVPLLPTAELALDAMLIQEGIYLSDSLGREVTIDEVIESSKSTAIKI